MLLIKKYKIEVTNLTESITESQGISQLISKHKQNGASTGRDMDLDRSECLNIHDLPYPFLPSTGRLLLILKYPPLI